MHLRGDWHDRKCEGWAYFEDLATPESLEEKPVEPQKEPSELLEQSKKEMENSFAQAVLDPTEENIFLYLELQNRWLKRAGKVSQIWAKVVLQNPELDNSIGGLPTSSYGVKFYHRQKDLEKKEMVKRLSESHSLICFYEGKNEASKELAKVIKLFSKKHDWTVQPISVDGVMVKEFPSSSLDQGLKDLLGVDCYPSVWVVEPDGESAKPVGFGLVSVDMIEENISIQYGINN